MENKIFRPFLSVGINGTLVINNTIDVKIINSNMFAFNVICRYNSIKKMQYIREKSKTHSVKAIYNSLGNCVGYKWQAK